MASEFHNTLNPKLWVHNRLKPEVASKLKEIADAFIESMEVPRNAIKDIVITGSSASYNYTPHSDIDLHLIVDFDKVHKDCPIVGDYLISKKSEFNNNHDIYIYGVPVEVYAEATDNENVHNGLYSLKDNRWIDEPKKLKPVDNDMAVNAKYKELAKAIEEVADKEESTQLMDKIKRMRKAGLAKEGEFSVENLVFKKLRNEGLIGKLADIKKQEIDKELSLEEAYERAIKGIEEMCTSTVAMAPYAVNVAGQENPSKKYNKQEIKNEKRGMYKFPYTKSNYSKKVNKMNISSSLMVEIANMCQAIINEQQYVFPKKAVEDGNAKLEQAFKDDVNARRLAKKAFKKVNKQAKDLRNQGIDPDIDDNDDLSYGQLKSKEAYEKALKTAANLQKKQFETSISTMKAQGNQHKLRARGLKGVKKINYEPVPTKKGDSHNFKIGIGESIKEIAELCEAIKNEVNPKLTVESLMLEVLNVCEEIKKVKLKSDYLKDIPGAEESLAQAKRVRDRLPLDKNNPERAKAEEGVQAAIRNLMEIKKRAGFSVNDK